jgi:hypothetical protein
MKNYKVTVHPWPYNNTIERWFSSKKETREYARYMVKLGWTPYIEVFNESRTEGKKFMFPSVAVAMFLNGVF